MDHQILIDLNTLNDDELAGLTQVLESVAERKRARAAHWLKVNGRAELQKISERDARRAEQQLETALAMQLQRDLDARDRDFPVGA
jgi:hypothetical protein